MNILGIKGNRKSVQLGNKLPPSGYFHGIKSGFKNDIMGAVKARANPEINKENSNVIDSQKMPTGIDKLKSYVSSKSGLERPNK